MYCGVFLSNNCALRSGSNLALVANNAAAVYVRNISNSTSAFRVESSSAGNAAIFNVDTTNSRVGIGTATPGYTLDISGNANIAGGSLTAGQTNLIQSLTNASSSGGTIKGYSQAITVSNTVSATTTNGIDIAISDTTSGISNVNTGIKVAMSGSSNSQQIGADISTAAGIAIKAKTTNSSGNSATCANLTGNISIAVCADNAGTAGNSGTGVYARTLSDSITLNVSNGAGIYGLNNSALNEARYFKGVVGVSNPTALALAGTTVGVYGESGAATASTAATTYGGYFTLSSSSLATSGAALFASNSTAATNILQLKDNTTDVFVVADGGAITASGTINGQTISSAANFTGTMIIAGDTNLNGNTTIGNATTDRLTVNSQILNYSGNNALSFQGATDDGFTTTFAITDPTANNTITFPNETGTVCTSAASSTSICTNFAAASSLAGYATTTLNNLGTTAISADLSFASGSARVIKNTSGNLTISTNTSGILALTSVGALNLTGAAASTWQTSAGALTITAGAASTWSSSSGALTITSAAAATWGTTTGTLTIGPADLSTLILRTNNSTRFTLANNASTLTGSGATSLVGGSTLTLNAAAASALNLGTTATTGSINIGTNITSGAITIGSTNTGAITYIKSQIGGTITVGGTTNDQGLGTPTLPSTILFQKEMNHYITVDNSTDVSSSNGGSLYFKAGDAYFSASPSAGGSIYLTGGAGIVGASDAGGDIRLEGGTGALANGAIYLSASATTISTVVSAVGDALTVINAGTGASLRVNDDGTSTDSSPFIIDTAGNVVIGKATAASAKLDIVSSATTGTGTLLTANSVTTGSAFRLESNAITTGSGIIVNQLTGAARAAGGSLLNLRGGNQATGTGSDGNVIRIEDSNGLCIGNPGAAAMAFACVSDQSTKDNIVDADNVLADLSTIQVRAFDMKSDGSHVKYGVVAQELESTGLNWLVGVDENGLKTVRGLDPWLLTKGIQELNTKVDTMQAGLPTSVLAAIADANAITINGTLTINGVTIFNDEVRFSSDTAGTTSVVAGDTTKAITFSKPFSKAPVVSATPNDFVSGGYRVVSVSITGFTIELESAQAADKQFSWQALVAQ